MTRAFKVTQGHPYWCRQESRTVCCRNVQLMLTLFLKLTKMWQRQNSKFVDFKDPTQVARRPSKKRFRISTNDLHCQKLQLLTYIFVADSVGVVQDKKGKGRYSSSWDPTSELRNVTCHMGSHSVTCHPTQVNSPRLTPAMQAGTRFTYRGGYVNTVLRSLVFT